jgi:transcriptional regulator GlxA family with amidase domain
MDARASTEGSLAVLGRRVALLLGSDFDLHSLACVVDALRLVNQAIGQTAYSWEVISLGGHQLVSACGVEVSANWLLCERLEELRRMDCLFVLSKGTTSAQSNTISKLLVSAKNAAAEIFGIGCGVYEAARAGLLRRGALHWEKVGEFENEFGADIDATTDLLTADRGTFTCPGGTAAMDLMVHLIVSHHGEEIAAQLCRLALVERVRPLGERQRISIHGKDLGKAPKLREALCIMSNVKSSHLDVGEICERINLSRRQLERLFETYMGTSPFRFFQSLRLQHADALLVNSNEPVNVVARKCGFTTPSHFTRVYKLQYGILPRAVRMGGDLTSRSD